MTINEIKGKLKSPEYDFLRTNSVLGNRIILLTVGGSHAYGTETPTSDLDIRGCSLNSKEEILLYRNFEQFIHNKTDTVIYSFNKLINLLSSVNPNTIELLGNKPEHYFYISEIGQLLIDNASLFLSKRAVNSFGGYANQQLRRMENKALTDIGQRENEQHILKTIEYAGDELKKKYFPISNGAIKLHIDKAVNPLLEEEIFMDINLNNYPLRDFSSMLSEMQTIVKSFNDIGRRNKRAQVHEKIGKHMMHLVRLYLMCFDILEQGKIITYREKEREYLMDIRNGKYLEDNKPTEEFYKIIKGYEKRLDYAKNNTSLPENPDMKKIDELRQYVNEMVIRGDV